MTISKGSCSILQLDHQYDGHHPVDGVGDNLHLKLGVGHHLLGHNWVPYKSETIGNRFSFHVAT